MGLSHASFVSKFVSLPCGSVKRIDGEEIKWSGRRDSNPRPSAPKADALPDCATPRLMFRLYRETVLKCPQDTRHQTLHAQNAFSTQQLMNKPKEQEQLYGQY